MEPTINCMFKLSINKPIGRVVEMNSASVGRAFTLKGKEDEANI